jgi:MOSC domain-containing protein YiiM
MMAVPGRIHQLSVSSGGVPKKAIARAFLGTGGLAGDRQKHTKFHGGPERALCIFSLEVIERLRAEGHPVVPGSVGENVTTSGIDLAALRPGSRLGLGPDAVVEVASYCTPCHQIAASFKDGKSARFVIREGEIAAGDEVRVLS